MLRFVLATALALSIANAADVKRPRITGVAHYATDFALFDHCSSVLSGDPADNLPDFRL